MEKELFVRQVTRRGGGQDQSAEIEQTSKGVNKLRDAERRLVPAPDDNSARSSRSKIQSVPRIVGSHSNLDKYFKPRVLAMGPIHHDKCIEKLKYALAADFIKDSGCTYDQLYKQILDCIAEIKDCYNDDETLTWMLFIDGCSTLQFMHKIDRLEEFGMNRTQAAFARLDLFLLENQLPYQVLEELMISASKNQELFRSIQSFVELQIIAAEKPPDRLLLEVQAIRAYLYEAAGHHLPRYGHPTYHLLDFLRERMLGPSPEVPKDDHRKEDNSPSFRNAQELKAAGVHFRRSKTSSLWDISFTSVGFVGFLNLPPINEDAMPLFLNLIAYEMCPDFPNNFGVTSYFSFLSSLIAHPDDAKQLRSARILCNLRGSDEALADLFHEIGPDLVLAHPMYNFINAKLEKHYKTKWKAWFAQFFEDHFSSPLVMLAFIGALTALVLSGIQTWYTVLSFYQK
ncbi:uncharacterized protein LOC110745689 [Prunus avium]|uniref:Uncharacterized protein LOC110745689 n=1 Tax=Prunus avium TaxID=42229 RepID=A0A6P5RF95_PRUAV|nr:uncharacterized protein LOC110745689 [Prunus avium]